MSSSLDLDRRRFATSKMTPMTPAMATRPATVNVPATAAVSEKKLEWGSRNGVGVRRFYIP